MRRSSSEFATDGVAPEIIATPETKKRPKYLRVEAPELMRALKPVLSEILTSRVQPGGNGDLSKEESLIPRLNRLMDEEAGLENLQFLVQQPVNGKETNSKNMIDFVEVSKEDRKTHTDPIFKLGMSDDQFIYRSGEFEVDALGFFQGLFDILAMADCITEEEKDLLIGSVNAKLSDERLSFRFQEQDFVTQGGPGIAQIQIPHEIPESEMPGAPKWQRIQSVFNKFLITPKLCAVELRKPVKEEKLGSAEKRVTEVA